MYAFDKAETELLTLGYTRVYYSISNMYGNYKAVRLMHKFHNHIVAKFNLSDKCYLFGFSRGGLYAFNYTLFYPETVEKVYLDAPVLDLKTWPPKDSEEQKQMFEGYSLNPETLMSFHDNPIDNLKEFFDLRIPLLLVAGDSDQVVDFEKNSNTLINYCLDNKIKLKYYVKTGCKHHPHSLDDVSPIVNFVCNGKQK